METHGETTEYEAATTAPARLLTIDATAAALDCSRATVYRLIQAGRIPVLRVGSRIRVHPDDLRGYYTTARVPREGAP
jgi:excisionase family DNA binding protein